MSPTETIAAIATPAGQGGVGVVRVSGPEAFAAARALCGHEPDVGRATFRRFCDNSGDVIDEGLLLAFANPRSFTGEDVVEFQIHGGPWLLARLMDTLCREHPIRPARPGEFSERAFHNGKLDLVQAEAIADMIAAGSLQAARAAQRSLSGVFSKQCHALHEGLLDLRMRLEAAIDFPEEDIDFLSDPELRSRWQTLHVEHAELVERARHGVQLSQGLTIVLAGAPNAGKSSILNYLSREDTAIVSAIAGTTRDVLRSTVQLAGVPVTLIDTAGLRDSDDPIEQEGVRRAELAIANADYLLHVCAPDVEDIATPPTQARVIKLHNKADLGDDPTGWLDAEQSEIRLSALTGEGFDVLVEALVGHQGESDFSARQRHVDALLRLGRHLDEAGRCLDIGAGDIAAEELRLGQRELGEITGQVHSDELLGRIFSSFCIGK